MAPPAKKPEPPAVAAAIGRRDALLAAPPDEGFCKRVGDRVEAALRGAPVDSGDGAALEGRRVLVITGAGAQSRFLRGSYFLGTSDDVDEALGVDCSLALAAARLRWAFVSLNVTWPVAFHFHGTIPEDTVVARAETSRHAPAASAYLRRVFGENFSEAEHEVDIVFMGVGFSGKNGPGLPEWLTALAKGRVAIVDPTPSIARDRRVWLNKCAISEFEHVATTCEDFLGPLPAGVTPTPGAVQAAFETEAVAWAKITEDPTVLGIINGIFAGNEWSEPDTRRRRGRS